MNTEQQKDEIVALESICNEEEFSYRESDGKYDCTLKIFLRLPGGYTLRYKDTRAPDSEATGVPISHLPPLVLHVSLPPVYPSESPPNFTLCCSWLRHAALQKLCRKLDKLWIENARQEIIFTWMDFLQNETLEFLGIHDHLDVSCAYSRYTAGLDEVESARADGEDWKTSKEVHALIKERRERQIRLGGQQKISGVRNNQKQDDHRAIVDPLMGKNPVQALVNYNEKRIAVEFKKSFYMCKICFNEKSGKDSTAFTPCRHVFCKDCILGYLETRIKDGNVKSIGCPEEKCTAEATPGQIKDLVSPELFAKYDSILLRVTLETMIDIVYCPRRHCQYPVSQEPNEQMANCPACQYAFCIYCKMVYHGIEPCKVGSAGKHKIVSQYEAASGEMKLKMEQRYGKKQLQTLMENTMSEKWITRNSHNCPQCNAAIEKSDGCNKMTCGRCGTCFCWICGARLNPKMPYSHYEDSGSKCFNMLFRGIIIDEEDEDEDVAEFPLYLGVYPEEEEEEYFHEIYDEWDY